MLLYLLTSVVLFFLVIPIPLFSQESVFTPPEKTNCPRSLQQASIWYFGDKAGIDFTFGSAIALTNQDVMTAYKASGVMSDSVGNLLFFTNGRRVWDRSFALMQGATELEGDVGVSQPCIIVPCPGSFTLYYIFTVDVMAFMPDNTYTTNGLTYTIVDMLENGGMGGAPDYVNVPLLTPVCQKITAVNHANGNDYWIIAHLWDSDAFYAFLLDESGLHDPVISQTGAFHGGGYIGQVNAVGYMVGSPDGSRLALAITGTKNIESFSFNTSTGEVVFTGSYTTTIPGISPYGIAFSPDSKFFYTSVMQITGNGPPSNPSYILQFDAGSSVLSPEIIDSVSGVRLGAMQLAPDGRIYVSQTINLVSLKDSLDVIYNPTRPAETCNYNLLDGTPDSRFSLEGRGGIYSLPNILQGYVDIPLFTYDSCCFLDFTRFRITNKANIDQVLWDFGDGSSSTEWEPLHFYAQPGAYTVVLTEYFNGESFADSGMVFIHDLPVVELGDTVMLYTGSVMNLRATDNMQSYTWSTGYTEQVLPVDQQGEYWVEVKDWHCCTNRDSVYVKVFEYFVPNAFTPNGDGLNDVFRAVGLYRDIQFKMVIYDRWGQQVFQSDDLEQGWDGTYKNQLAGAGTYVWIIFVDFLGEDIITDGDVVLKGTVNLVR